MGAATGSATPGSRDAPGNCTARCRRPPRPRRTARQQTPTESTTISYGTAQAGAQTLAASGLRDFRVPFVSDTLSALTPYLPQDLAGLQNRHSSRFAVRIASGRLGLDWWPHDAAARMVSRLTRLGELSPDRPIHTSSPNDPGSVSTQSRGNRLQDKDDQ